MCAGSKPGLVSVSLKRLRRRRPALTRRTSVRATSEAMITDLTRVQTLEVERWLPVLMVSEISTCDALKAGASPDASPVKRARAVTAETTCQSMAAPARPGRVEGRSDLK